AGRICLMRDGSCDEALFVLLIADDEPADLAGLVAALSGPQRVWAVYLDADEAPDRNQRGELLLDRFRQLQPAGHYRLAAYRGAASIALAMASRLLAQGEVVEPLVLIEPGPAPTVAYPGAVMLAAARDDPWLDRASLASWSRCVDSLIVERID